MKSQTTLWPSLNYQAFKSTGHLLHMAVQIIGKLKLTTPFEPHWSNVAIWLTPRGLTTGLIPYQSFAFAIDLDLHQHKIIFTSSQGKSCDFSLNSMSVANLYTLIFEKLAELHIDLKINPMPQEITNPIAFNQDIEPQAYDKTLATDWFNILVNIYRVLQRYHARFDGETPAVALMWGTFDIRDVRFNGQSVPTTGVNAGYIRRNAMNEAQVEVGWWPGNEAYPKPAFYAFTYPKPEGLENKRIQPEAAHWDSQLEEFILNYDDLLKTNNPDQSLLDFFESAYQAGAELSGWKDSLITTGVPV